MRRATHVIPASEAPKGDTQESVTLAFDDRHRRRIRLTDDRGEDFLLDLCEAARMSDGDCLAIEGGGILRVRAAAEDVADIICDCANGTTRIAWHLGNRHTPVQVLDNGGLRIRYDHVLVEMAEGLGAGVERKMGPFEPEAGAYAGGGHGHRHDP
jgi:urease accessory protein